MAANYRDVISLKELSITPYNVITELGGSTGPKLVMNNEEKYVLKFSNSRTAISDAQRNAHAANEYLAFMLYDAAYLSTPPIIKLVQDAETDRVGVLESYIEGDTLADILDSRLNTYNEDIAKKVIEITFPILQKELLVHALLGNWDITNNQNIMIPKSESGEYEFDNPIVIDCGGTLMFRAQGEFKRNADFTKDVSNIGSIITFSASRYEKPFKHLKHMKKANERNELKSIKTPELTSLLCSNWSTEKGDSILAALERERPIVEPYYKKVGKSYDELIGILEGRINFINEYCSLSGGKRRRHTRKTRKHRHRSRKTKKASSHRN